MVFIGIDLPKDILLQGLEQALVRTGIWCIDAPRNFFDAGSTVRRKPT